MDEKGEYTWKKGGREEGGKEQFTERNLQREIMRCRGKEERCKRKRMLTF